MVESKTILKCKDCAWAKLPIVDGMVRCEYWSCNVWADSLACREKSDIGIF